MTSFRSLRRSSAALVAASALALGAAACAEDDGDTGTDPAVEEPATDGAVDDGAMDDGAMDDGAMDDGTMEEPVDGAAEGDA